MKTNIVFSNTASKRKCQLYYDVIAGMTLSEFHVYCLL